MFGGDIGFKIYFILFYFSFERNMAMYPSYSASILYIFVLAFKNLYLLRKSSFLSIINGRGIWKMDIYHFHIL